MTKSPGFTSVFHTRAGRSFGPTIWAFRLTELTVSRMEGVSTRNDRPPTVHRLPIRATRVSARTTPSPGTFTVSRSRTTICFLPEGSSRTTRVGSIVLSSPPPM